MIEMIIADLDNTLLRSEKVLSEYTVAVLTQAQAAGIKVAFATARSERAAAKFLAQFSPDIFIGYGGALIQAGDEVIHRFDISAELSAQIIGESLRMPEVASVWAINESVALTNSQEDLGADGWSHYQHHDFSGENTAGYLKISLISASPDAVERIASHYPMCDMLRYSGEDLYRFAHRKAVKWNAVKIAAAHFGIETDKIAAFGDDTNDLEMIQNCGIGVAVENAVDAVRAVADHICGTNDKDGVAAWIEQHLLCDNK